MIGRIDEQQLGAGVSIKLTQIGLAIDPNVCEANLQKILREAASKNVFVRIDMEDSCCTEITLDLFDRMINQYQFSNCGIVIQSYLYRSIRDVEKIIEFGGKIRICKGAYKEPESIAFARKKDVDESFDRIVEVLVDGAIRNKAPAISPDGRIPPIPAVATHDPARLKFAKQYAVQKGLKKQALEFQMLYGIRKDLQKEALNQGYPVRVYVPYGTEWYPYFMRRLAERPANLWFFISNLFRF
jgi:proline dehydrogenase